jgi:hypothetical protein
MNTHLSGSLVPIPTGSSCGCTLGGQRVPSFGTLAFAWSEDVARTVEVLHVPAFACSRCTRLVYDLRLQLLLEERLSVLFGQGEPGPRIAFADLGIQWPPPPPAPLEGRG